MFWSFSVKGTFPVYKVPKVEKTQLDQKLRPETIQKLKHKAFDRDNLIMRNIGKTR
jgi:hypothetical protein